MPEFEAPQVELGSAPETPSIITSPSPSEVSTTSSPEPPIVRTTPLFRALAMPPPDPEQPPGQDELERRLPGYRRIVIPRELTLIELLKQCSGARTDEEVLRIREATLRVVAERVGLRRLNVLTPRLKSLTLDGSAMTSLRDLGIGLKHLKYLSVKRCGLTCLDGVWGLGVLRELHAAGNRIRDLQPLAALQKLHTVDMADNPIEETSRIWTLGICGSLRKLTLSGTPASEATDYRTRIATALPMLVYLDDRPLHTDVLFESEDLFDPDSGSDSEGEADKKLQPTEPVHDDTLVLEDIEPTPGPSTERQPYLPRLNEDNKYRANRPLQKLHRRPATTEGAGSRPKVTVPPRPRTAVEKHVEKPSRLYFMNTLMDEEWQTTGSKLTSYGIVCGNLTRALRRPSTAPRRSKEAEKVDQTMQDVARAIAAEIPRVPRIEEWDRFRRETGIDIDIDFNVRPEGDPSRAIERLEQIEKETQARLNHQDSQNVAVPNSTLTLNSVLSDFESWKADLTVVDAPTDVDSLFQNIGVNLHYDPYSYTDLLSPDERLE